ncbi:MAG: hypothetical protein V4568_06255 [Pseudomonadota bacterium]
MLEVAVNDNVIRIGARFAVSLQRTLRIPDDGRGYPLPPGLGAFPIFNVSNYSAFLPATWNKQDSVFIPMYQREALWLGFNAAGWKPNAVQVAIGGINAISGEHEDVGLHQDPQNYVVCPPQLWLDGINSGDGLIRQFVAVPLGSGYTAEAALTGAETVGGIQIKVFEPKPGRFPDQPPPEKSHPQCFASPGSAMGLGAGGTMRQKIYADPYGVDTWDEANYGGITIHIINSAQFKEITGTSPPPSPIDAHSYTKYGLPWFELYDDSIPAIQGAKPLVQIKTISDRDRERGMTDVSNHSVDIGESQIQELREKESRGVEKPFPPSNSKSTSP